MPISGVAATISVRPMLGGIVEEGSLGFRTRRKREGMYELAKWVSCHGKLKNLYDTHTHSSHLPKACTTLVKGRSSRKLFLGQL